jgi:sigma-B regulation protein RsbU (phosphoserine phosphatase)
MGTWEWDLSQYTMKWDCRMHEIFGLKQGTFGGRYENFLQLIAPEDRERIAGEVSMMLRNCSDYDGEFRALRPLDGSMRVLRMRSKIYCDVEAKATRLSGVAWDVTERRQTENDLVKGRHLFRALMDNLPDNIYFKDTESRFIAVNHAMAMWFGLDDPEAMVGKTDFDLFTEEHARAALENEKLIIETGEPIIGIEEEETWEDGHKTWVSTTKMPLRDSHGKIIGTFGLSRDITKRKQAENMLASVARELRKKNEMLEEDLQMARELQHAMLPQRYPTFPVSPTDANSIVQFYHYYTPSMAVSGDFFDVFKISDTMAGIFICDVMGHGVRAAMVAAMIRTLIGELHAAWKNPGELLSQLNRNLRTALGHSQVPMFASAFYVAVDLRNGKLHYANAGHPHPLRLHHHGAEFQPRELNGIKPGPALGLFGETRYENCTCELLSHDVVLLFTDGLFEVEGPQGDFYDYHRLLRAVGKRGNLTTMELCQDLIDEVQQFAATKEFSDDVCLVAMEVDRLASDPL